MNHSRIYLSSPHMGGEELLLVQDAFATNWIAPLGPHVDAFERVHRCIALAIAFGEAFNPNAAPADCCFCFIHQSPPQDLL